jgi:DNA gyrase/topoisomerase IV subunit B
VLASAPLREIIANALDEQVLTNTKDVEIYRDQDRTWHIRDFGRGLSLWLLDKLIEFKRQKITFVVAFIIAAVLSGYFSPSICGSTP